MITIRTALTALLLILITGCTSLPSKTPPAENAEQLYQAGRQAQSNGNHQAAIDHFSQLSHKYPASPYVQQAAIETAYAHYQLKQYDQAVAEAEQFLKQNPKHKSADYARYLTGLALSEQAAASGEQLDPQLARAAYHAFTLLLQHHPDSQYGDTAKQRMTTLRNQLARQELVAVRSYLTADNQPEAIRRAKYINQHYAGTPAAAEALELVTRAATVEIKSKQTGRHLKITAPGDTESNARERWVLQQNPDFYTLQIGAGEARQPLTELAQQHEFNGRSALLHRQHGQRDWYTLFYGSFISWSEAIDAAIELRQQTGLSNVEIRQYRELQQFLQR